MEIQNISPQIIFNSSILNHWVIPEKIHTSPTDGTLEILAGGGVEGSGNPGGRGGLDLKLFFGGH